MPKWTRSPTPSVRLYLFQNLTFRNQRLNRTRNWHIYSWTFLIWNIIFTAQKIERNWRDIAYCMNFLKRIQSVFRVSILTNAVIVCFCHVFLVKEEEKRSMSVKIYVNIQYDHPWLKTFEPYFKISHLSRGKLWWYILWEIIAGFSINHTNKLQEILD